MITLPLGLLLAAGVVLYARWSYLVWRDWSKDVHR